MNILVCTSLDLNTQCAALNRIENLSKALFSHGINIYSCGSCKSELQNYFVEGNKVFFSKPTRYLFLPKAFQYNLNAAFFYRNNLEKIINDLKIEGIIIYSMFSTMIEPITEIGKKKGIFVVNDGGEKYSITFQNLLNGVNYMQYRAIFYSFRKLDGLMVCSPRWEKYAKSIKKPNIFFPSFMPLKKVDKKLKPKEKEKFRIVFMGSFSPREKPKTILNGFLKCLNLGYDFELVIIGRQALSFLQKYSWGKIKQKIQNNKNIIFTDFISSKERDEWLSSADCFVLLRPACNETYHLFPTRLPEYFSTSKPVILTNVEPFSLFYKDKKEVYFLSRQNSAKELAKVFIELFENPLLRNFIGENGRKYSCENYSYAYLGEKISKFLKKLRK
ncbi:hypothetical protein B0W81_02360 [Prochlorococcus sp. HOT_208_60]|nr:hypothetical protein B0W81_02360 [Prochlorococcus sp. HOT_208_60]